MAEHYPDDGVAANDFGRRHLHESEARLLYEADYPPPPDMWAPGSWRLSAGGVSVPPLPSRVDRRVEIAHIRSSLSESSRNQPRYAPDSNTRRALEDIVAQRRGCEKGGVVILDDSDEEAPGPSNPVGHGDPGHGCIKDGGGVQDDDDYTNFYKLLGM
ncbi:Homeobox protein KNOX3 [Hordeum vulgare]|nr:Homeobox protein KNOX3 [Hordeum vulgare]